MEPSGAQLQDIKKCDYFKWDMFAKWLLNALCRCVAEYVLKIKQICVDWRYQGITFQAVVVKL